MEMISNPMDIPHSHQPATCLKIKLLWVDSNNLLQMSSMRFHCDALHGNFPVTPTTISRVVEPSIDATIGRTCQCLKHAGAKPVLTSFTNIYSRAEKYSVQDQQHDAKEKSPRNKISTTGSMEFLASCPEKRWNSFLSCRGMCTHIGNLNAYFSFRFLSPERGALINVERLPQERVCKVEKMNSASCRGSNIFYKTKLNRQKSSYSVTSNIHFIPKEITGNISHSEYSTERKSSPGIRTCVDCKASFMKTSDTPCVGRFRFESSSDKSPKSLRSHSDSRANIWSLDTNHCSSTPSTDTHATRSSNTTASFPTKPTRTFEQRWRPTKIVSDYPSRVSTLLSFVLVFLTLVASQTNGQNIKAGIHAIYPDRISMSKALSTELISTLYSVRRNLHVLRSVYDIEHVNTSLKNDDPKEILNLFCKGVFPHHVTTILNINNPLGMKRRTSSNQYILELASYLGLPIISWDTEYIVGSQSLRTVQLAPTIEHQAKAMVSMLERYNWTAFTIVTGPVSGSSQFVTSIENMVEQSQKNALKTPAHSRKESLNILSIINIRKPEDILPQLVKVKGSDTRVFLLHSASSMALDIIQTARTLNLTDKDYVWILTRTAIPNAREGPRSFPVGLMGIDFDFELTAMRQALKWGIMIWLNALADMAKTQGLLANMTIPPKFSCDSDKEPFWRDGEILYRHMLKVNILGEPQIKFNENGTLQQTDLIIVNLQWIVGGKNKTEWKQVGRWTLHGLKMNEIVWPGESTVPPTGKPKRAFLRVATLNELPYVIYRNLSENGGCEEKSLPCQIYNRNDKKEITSNVTIAKCCAGLSMDLLKILSDQLNFDYEIKEVIDGKWGVLINKTTNAWNGLVKALLNNEADIVMTAFKINPERASAVNFSVPYLETGIKIIVALRDGAISPTAFLEPFDFFSWMLIMLLSVHFMATVIFLCEWALPKNTRAEQEPYDYASWSLILIFSVHATGSSILIFEWLSPYGLNRGHTPMRDHKFSLFRSFWLIWAMLFSTSVQTDTPKGIASRFLANIWALFALVFLASYTANLAAFMITKEEFYDLSGIQDYRLQNPYTMKPPFRYATIPNGSTEANIRANHKDMYNYMKAFNQPDVDAGIAELKQGRIQAFIYDSSVLEYYASRDPKCRLVTVGNRYAMTGYGVGFPPNNKPSRNPWIDKFNKHILKLQENGDMDRLQKFWLAGACDTKKEKGVSNRTLGILNFTSAFILLGSGVLLGLLILIFEHLYFKFCRKRLRKWDKCGCCALVSLSMGKSLQFKDYVDEAMSAYSKTRCKNPVCEIQIWKLRHQLDMALLKIDHLQNQLCEISGEFLPLMPSSTVENEKRTEHQQQKPLAVRANGMQQSQHYKTEKSNHRQGKKTASKLPSQSAIDLPEVSFLRSLELRDGGNFIDKFEEYIENYEKPDSSPVADHFSDPLLPPPPQGESPLLGSSACNDDTGGGGSSYGGDTFLGFDDFHSENAGSRSASVLAGRMAAMGSSPGNVLRRTPSYTSAVGRDNGLDSASDSSPNMTGRVRQYDGKTYVGVDSSSTVT